MIPPVSVRNLEYCATVRAKKGPARLYCNSIHRVLSAPKIECCGFRIYPRISIEILLRIGSGSDLPSKFRIWTDLILNLSDCKDPILSEMKKKRENSTFYFIVAFL